MSGYKQRIILPSQSRVVFSQTHKHLRKYFLSHDEHVYVLVRVSTAMIKHHDQNQLGE